MNTKNRIKGGLFGTLIGDALGAPLEFMSIGQITQKYGRLTEMIGGGAFGWKPGESTDDGDLTLITVKSIVERKGWFPYDIAQGFVNWLTEKPIDVGRTTAEAIHLITRGIPWHQAGKIVSEHSNGQAAGNGSLMRCAPVAFYGYKMPLEEIVKMSLECSTITHADPRCLWACAVYNVMLTLIMYGVAKENLIAKTKKCFQGIPRAMEIINIVTSDNLPKTSGFVLDTLQSALLAFLTIYDFEETLVTAVNWGGDADSRGAVVGALAGTYYGYGAIPERWIKTLANAAENKELAEKLCELTNSSTDFKYIKIAPGLLLGPIPKSKEKMAELKNRNVGAVLSVIEDFEGVDQIGELAKLHNIEHKFVPIRDAYYKGAPTIEQIEGAVKIIDEWIKKGKIVYLHCYLAIGRSPLIAIAYLCLAKKMCLAEAIFYVKQRWPNTNPNSHQIKVLYDLLNNS